MLRYLIVFFFDLRCNSGPGSPFRLLFRTLKPVLFVQVMPVVTRSVRLPEIKPDLLVGGEGKERCLTVSAPGVGAECTSSRTFSTHR